MNQALRWARGRSPGPFNDIMVGQGTYRVYNVTPVLGTLHPIDSGHVQNSISFIPERWIYHIDGESKYYASKIPKQDFCF